MGSVSHSLLHGCHCTVTVVKNKNYQGIFQLNDEESEYYVGTD